MQKSQRMEETIVSAVKDFSHTISAESRVVADISVLIDATNELPLEGFDFWERLIRDEYSQTRRESKPSELVNWLDLMSRDGYKREKVMRALSGAAPNAFFFALAVRRLNDWVPQVRKAAREKLPEIAKATNSEYVVEALCVALSNWNSWGRIEAEDKAILLQIISEPEIAQCLRRKLISSPSGPMPSLFSQLGRTSILDGQIEDIARLSIQPCVRAKAYRSLFEGRLIWVEGRQWEWTDVRYCLGRLRPAVSERKIVTQLPFIELLKRSSEDRSSIVRRVSAEMLIRELDNLGTVAQVFAMKFASDPSHPVSERGTFALRQLDGAE